MSTYKPGSDPKFPPWMYTTGTSSPVSDAIVAFIGCIFVLSLFVGITFIISAVILIELFELFPAIHKILFIVANNLSASDILTNARLGAIGGLLTGIFVSFLRSFGISKGESFISAAINNSLRRPKIDFIFFGRILVGGMVGTMVSFIMGSLGSISFPQLFWGGGSNATSAATYNVLINIISVFPGGGGGSGLGLGFLLGLIALVVLLIVIGIIVGIFIGVFIQICLLICVEFIEGLTLAFVDRILFERDNGNEGKIIYGIIRGAWIGAVNGIVISICTTIGIIQVY